MRLFQALVLVLMVGCTAVPTPPPAPASKPVFKLQLPPLPSAPLVMKKSAIRPLVKALPQIVQPIATNVPGIASIKYLPDQKAIQAQWSARPLKYSLESSTNLISWVNIGTVTNAIVEEGQAQVPTTAFPSGQAVVFTNGTPVIIFLDYAVDRPAKFYRVREIQP